MHFLQTACSASVKMTPSFTIRFLMSCLVHQPPRIWRHQQSISFLPLQQRHLQAWETLFTALDKHMVLHRCSHLCLPKSKQAIDLQQEGMLWLANLGKWLSLRKLKCKVATVPTLRAGDGCWLLSHYLCLQSSP